MADIAILVAEEYERRMKTSSKLGRKGAVAAGAATTTVAVSGGATVALAEELRGSDGCKGYAGGATAYPCRGLVFTAGGLPRSGLYCRVCLSPAQGGATTVYARRALLEKILDPSLLRGMDWVKKAEGVFKDLEPKSQLGDAAFSGVFSA